ncbi:MAG: hypothetical protein CVT64_02305 [Actinobacteria bacterium HGW-Actinobacteria-4]|nr:MAG: hypothetical protein CVT64_02305 [Actinobacteria bacterium HGW-Actinobacteria-4]
MTDGPVFMPHPDDPPAGSTPPKNSPPPAEPVADVAAVIASMPTRIEGDDPAEQDSLGQWSLWTGGLAAFLMLLQYGLGRVPLIIPALIAGVAIYFGVRGLAAARRGSASNAWMSMLGIATAVLALVSIALYYLIIVAFVATVLDGVTPAS